MKPILVGQVIKSLSDRDIKMQGNIKDTKSLPGKDIKNILDRATKIHQPAITSHQLDLLIKIHLIAVKNRQSVLTKALHLETLQRCGSIMSQRGLSTQRLTGGLIRSFLESPYGNLTKSTQEVTMMHLTPGWHMQKMLGLIYRLLHPRNTKTLSYANLTTLGN
jgi:hypothetical protein